MILVTVCVVGASPLELNTALMSSGSLGVVHESNASGPLNADVLVDTNNVLVDSAMFHAVSFEPQAIQVSLSAFLSCYLATLLHGMLGYEVCGVNKIVMP